MASALKRLAKGFLIILISLIFTVILVVGILINFIFTPEKLTPKLVQEANTYVEADLDLGRVELTLFSTFPDLTVILRDGALVQNETDSLMSFSSLEVSLNLLSILKGDELVIDNLSIQDPTIWTVMYADGRINWDIFGGEEEIEVSQDTTVQASSFDNALIVRDFSIQNAHVFFVDSANSFTSSIYRASIDGNMLYESDILISELDLALNDVLLTLEEEPLLNPVSLKFHAINRIDLETNDIFIDTVNLKVEDHKLEVGSKGFIQMDTTDFINVNLENRIFTSNIREALDLIPLRYVDLQKLDGKGQVDLTANIVGSYGDKTFPNADIDLKITGAQAAYEGFPKSIDLFETAISAKVDFLNKSSSYIRVPKLVVKSEGLTLDLKGNITRTLTNPHVVGNVKGAIHFEELLETIPIPDLKAKGDVGFSIETDLYLQDVVNYNYGKIGMDGTFDLSNVDFNYNDSISLKSTESHLIMGQDQNSNRLGQQGVRSLNVRVDFKDLNVAIDESMNLETKRLRGYLRTSPLADTTQISPIKGNLKLNRGSIAIGDSISINGNNIKTLVEFRSSKNDKTIPVLRSNLTSDRIRMTSGDDYATIRDLDYSFRVAKRDNQWPVTGDFAFSRLFFYLTSFPRKVYVEKTSIKVNTNSVELKNATVKVGRSKMNLTGTLYDLQSSISNTSSIRADLTIRSNNLNVNQITQILNQGSGGSVAAESQPQPQPTKSDSTANSEEAAIETFVVPENIDFDLKLNLKKVRYADLVLNDVKGNFLIKDQILKLNNFKMKTKAADLLMTARYKARDKQNARTNFNVQLTDVNVSDMMEIMPFMDTLLPMAKDFEGIVNLGIQGAAKIGENMAINESSLSAVARLEGQNVVLLDGETFQYMAKTLKFKNREKNTLDTLAVEMAIEDGSMEIFPSLVTMDRYKVAIGGIQNLDLSYKYHISVLKSPLPFKTGIDIKGVGTDYDYKIVKAKYKYIFSDKKKHKDKVDTDLVDRKNAILEKIKFDGD